VYWVSWDDRGIGGLCARQTRLRALARLVSDWNHVGLLRRIRRLMQPLTRIFGCRCYSTVGDLAGIGEAVEGELDFSTCLSFSIRLCFGLPSNTSYFIFGSTFSPNKSNCLGSGSAKPMISVSRPRARNALIRSETAMGDPTKEVLATSARKRP
jgi:hypothetical protein